ncbi:MAG: hypothetical protein SFU98_12055 [Leptospiraceae bacterium]|nr:hypothetical protein [Leptospiraceae bacterium]
MFLRISFCLLFFLLLNCSSKKKDISDSDVGKVIERMSLLRFSSRLTAEDLTAVKADAQVFRETCNIYRLNPDSVLEKLKTKHPSLYQKIKGSYD